MKHIQAVKAAPFAFVLLSFALGVFRLDFRALWGDEAYSWWASQQSALSLLGGLDAQPPMFHFVLAVDRVALGDSVFALRFASVLCGVLTVALAARAGRAVLGDRGAALCGLFLALAPMSVYYQQEARMYALAALFAVGAMAVTLGMVATAAPPRPRTWLAYVLLSLAALFTHYYSAAVLAVNALALLLVFGRRAADRRKTLAGWLAAQAAIALVFGAWFFGLQWRYLGRAAGGRAGLFAPLGELIVNVQRGVNGLIFGMRADAGIWVAAGVLFILIALGGVGLLRARATRRYAWIALGWIAATGLMVFLTASPGAIVPDFSPRYLIFMLLPMAVLTCGWVAPGISRPARIGAALTAGLLLAATVYGNARQFSDDWQKSRYDALLRAVRERAQPGDAAVLANSDQYPHYAYYGPTGLETWLIPNDVLNRPDQATAQFDDFLRRARPSRVWLVNYGFASVMQPRHAVEQRLNVIGARTYAQGFQDAALALYELLDASGNPPVTPLDVRFDDGIRLTGLRWRADAQASAGAPGPGGTAAFDLLWKADARPRGDYTVFVHLRNSATGEQIGVYDGPPANGQRPTSGWTPGEVVTDTRGIAIPAGAKPGDYDIVVGLYKPPENVRLRMGGGDDTEAVVKRFAIGP